MKRFACLVGILLLIFAVEGQQRNNRNDRSTSDGDNSTSRRYDPDSIERPTDVKQRVGEEAPHVSAQIVRGGDGRNDLSSFFGEVVILHVFQSDDDHSIYAMNIMKNFHRKYNKKGVSIVACTPEQDNKILALFLTSQHLPYKVFIQTSGVVNYSTYVTYTYVIGAGNKVLWQGVAVDLSDKVIRKALAEHKKFLYSQYKKISKSIISKILKKDYGKALKDVNKLLEKTKNKESEKYQQAQDLAEKLDAISISMNHFAGRKVNNRGPYEAMLIYRDITKNWKASTAYEDAKTGIKDLQTDFKKELEADRIFHKIIDKHILGKRKNKKAMLATIRNLEALLRRYEDTQIARKALEIQIMLKAIVD